MDPVRKSLAVSVILQFQEDSLLLERLSITFTSNGKGEFVPSDQVSSLLHFDCLLFLPLN